MRLLISSFDATIRVKRAFHPAPASRGFASHVFLVIHYPLLSFKFFFQLKEMADKKFHLLSVKSQLSKGSGCVEHGLLKVR